MEQVREWVEQAKRVTVLTGAGISTDSGIPDFRGPSGVWTRDPKAERLSNIDEYVKHPEVRRDAWLERRDHPAWTAEPNAAHKALVDLERSGRLVAIITQNIDGLHQKAGSDPDRVIEIHGTMYGVVCLGCADRTTMREALDRVAGGEEDPACLECGGILKSATISFGQRMDMDSLEAATEAAMYCDVFIAVGTSLTVHPVAGLAEVAKRRHAKLVIVNAEPTPYDPSADAVLREPISEALPAIVGAR
jgi:NAD-dependent deacetylase